MFLGRRTSDIQYTCQFNTSQFQFLRYHILFFLLIAQKTSSACHCYCCRSSLDFSAEPVRTYSISFESTLQAFLPEIQTHLTQLIPVVPRLIFWQVPTVYDSMQFVDSQRCDVQVTRELNKLTVHGFCPLKDHETGFPFSVLREKNIVSGGFIDCHTGHWCYRSLVFSLRPSHFSRLSRRSTITA